MSDTTDAGVCPEPVCGHRWSEHANNQKEGCTHRYADGSECPCYQTAPLAANPADLAAAADLGTVVQGDG